PPAPSVRCASSSGRRGWTSPRSSSPWATGSSARAADRSVAGKAFGESRRDAVPRAEVPAPGDRAQSAPAIRLSRSGRARTTSRRKVCASAAPTRVAEWHARRRPAACIALCRPRARCSSEDPRFGARMIEDLVVGLAGSGGDGVVSAGESLLAAASAQGFHALMTKSFGSQIRGGESSCRVRLSTRRVLNPGGVLDVAVALNLGDFRRFGAELPVGPETVLIHEAKAGPPPPDFAPAGRMPREVIGVPLAELAKSSAGTDRAKMTVVLGVLSGWFGIPREGLDRGLQKKFAQKGEGLLEANRKALASGMAFALEHPLASPRTLTLPVGASPKMLCDGNEMCASAAIFSGCEFFGGYPITPSTEVMQILARELPRYGGVVLQAEDEISGVGAAVGASFAGKKSMTATSGPGMSLKTEVLGLASIAELPLVLL